MKVTTNVAVSLVLIILYVYFFGRSSVDRYLKRAVYIIEEEEKYMQIPSPGTTATVTSLKSLRLRDLLTYGYLTFSLPFLAVPCLPTVSWVLKLTGPYLALLSLILPYCWVLLDLT